MQTKSTNLQKQAIDAALSGNWKAAIELNSSLLKKTPKDVDTKLRIGRAYIQIHEFTKAISIFNDVLKQDPINQIALKNLKIARGNKVENNKTRDSFSPKELIKVPGTSVEAKIDTKCGQSIIEELSTGDSLNLRIKKAIVGVHLGKNLLGFIDDPQLVRSLNKAKSNKLSLKVNYVRYRENKIIVLIKAPVPVFKAEKQEVRPYLKKGTIEEPELEMAPLEDSE